MDMQASVITFLRNGKSKTVTGKVLQRGLGSITLVVTDKKGYQRIKRFDVSKCTVRLFKESGEE